MKSWFIFKFALLVAFFSCGRISHTSKLKNVFGNDDRKEISDSRANPYAAVARIELENGVCSGFLIAPQLVLTNAHCMLDTESGKIRKGKKSVQFKFNFGEPELKIEVDSFWYGSHQPVENRAKDWAILKLKKVATGIEILTLKALDETVLPIEVNFAGYHNDLKKAAVLAIQQQNSADHSSGCKILKRDQKSRFLHDCDSTGGSSGSPIFLLENNKWTVVALNTSEERTGSTSVHADQYSESVTNYAISLAGVIAQLELLKNSDLSDKSPRPKDVFFAYNQREEAAGCQPASRESADKFFPVNQKGEFLTDKNSRVPNPGFTADQCQTAVLKQENGLICTVGNSFSIVNVGSKAVLASNLVSFSQFEECLKAVTFSTRSSVCIRTGKSNVSPIHIESGASAGFYSGENAFNSCVAYIQSEEPIYSDVTGANPPAVKKFAPGFETYKGEPKTVNFGCFLGGKAANGKTENTLILRKKSNSWTTWDDFEEIGYLTDKEINAPNGATNAQIANIIGRKIPELVSGVCSSVLIFKSTPKNETNTYEWVRFSHVDYARKSVKVRDLRQVVNWYEMNVPAHRFDPRSKLLGLGAPGANMRLCVSKMREFPLLQKAYCVTFNENLSGGLGIYCQIDGPRNDILVALVNSGCTEFPVAKPQPFFLEFANFQKFQNENLIYMD